jgi:Leucine-rich repeat (LRR) protein
MYEPNSRRGGTDLVEVVKPRYAAAFEATVAGASTLEFPGLGFTDSEARELLDVIVEHCTALKVLDLSDNNALTVPLTEWGPVAFAIGLQKLSLARNAALEASPLGAFGKCTALEVLDLRRCERVKGDVSEVMALVNLEVLNLSGTRVGGETYSLYP